MIITCIVLMFLWTSAAGSIFYNIYEYKNGYIHGITKNEPLIALATEEFVIFGKLSSDLYFSEISRSRLGKRILHNIDILEFKFIDKKVVVICDKIHCRFVLSFVGSISVKFLSYCEASAETFKISQCVLIYGHPMTSVSVQKGSSTIFLRIVSSYKTLSGYDTASIYSMKNENGIFTFVGGAADFTSAEKSFKIIYSFSYKKHIYFITQIKRRNIAMAFLTNSDKNYTKIKNDIVITQICDNDDSKEIISRMDLTLECGENSITYGKQNENYYNIITAATFLSKEELLLLGISNSTSNSFVCKFDMKDIEKEFQNTWNYCQNIEQPLKICKEDSYDALLVNGCLKLGWKNAINTFQSCKKFNSQKRKLLNSCQAVKFPINGERNGWLENVQPLFGHIIQTISNNSYLAFYPSQIGNEMFVLSNDSLMKATIKSDSLLSLEKLKHHFVHDKMITPWDANNGILYVDSVIKRNVYFKDFSCNKDDCYEILYTDPLRCGYCTVDENKECIYYYDSLLTYCAPLWFKHNYLQNSSIGDHYIDVYNRVKEINDKIITERITCDVIPEKQVLTCVKLSDKHFETVLTAANDHINVTAVNRNNNENLVKNVTVANETIKKNYANFLLFIALSALAFITCFITPTIFYLRYTSKKKYEKRFVIKYTNIPLVSFNPKKVFNNFIKSQNIKFKEEVGHGNSSDVHIAQHTNKGDVQMVAVKKLLKLEIEHEVEKMPEEITLLCSVKNKHIVQFIGWTIIEDKYCVVTEFMKGGDLHTYLKDPAKPLTLAKIFLYVFQVLDAMIYLSHEHILHRDLAARNCLLSSDNEILKVTDFGLSRWMNSNYEYIAKNDVELPFRFLPPETLSDFTFTVKGDVWAFAVLMWEIFERGAIPYNHSTLEGVKCFLNAGERLSRPDHCPLKLYKIMKSCWEKDPKQRPNFDCLLRDIEIVKNEIATKNSYQLNQPIRSSEQQSYRNLLIESQL